MGRLKRIINQPTKYFSPDYLLNKVICGRLFPLWLKISPLIKSDRLYIKIFYRLGMGRRLNLNNPQTYTEKLQWLKLHNTNPLFSRMVDKYTARKIVAEKIGEEYLVPLIGVWNKFEEIDFELLPNEFVLKTTHDSGTVIICNDKTNFDIEKARKILTKSLKTNYFIRSREYPYKYAVPRIICEKLLKDPANDVIPDFKFFCFNGRPELLLVVTGSQGKKYNSWYDKDFNKLPFKAGFPLPEKLPVKPANYESMLKLVEMLSCGFPHIRIDLYNAEEKIYFGEFTFHHAGGIIKFTPNEWDYKLGEMISLPIT